MTNRIGQYSESALRERLTFSLFLALILHAAFFFAIRLETPSDPTRLVTKEIVLLLRPSKTMPNDAPVLSNVNASGEKDHIRSRFQKTSFSPSSPSEQKTAPVTIPAEPARDGAGRVKPLSLSQDLRAYTQPDWRALDTVGQSDRVKRIFRIKAKASPEAFYLESWKRKIEAIGNLNYPADAKAGEIYGRLRVLVSIYPSGQVKEARILSSSGHPVLDQAALDIIDLASPFAPFPTALRKEADLLEIVRVWEFRRQGGRLQFDS